MNTGNVPVQSRNGLLTTVCYKLGQQAAVYALEVRLFSSEVFRLLLWLLSYGCSYYSLCIETVFLPYFCTQGSVAVAGEGVRWLRDNMGIIKHSAEVGIHRAPACLC